MKNAILKSMAQKKTESRVQHGLGRKALSDDRIERQQATLAKRTVRRVERLLRLADQAGTRKTTDWEDEFLGDVRDRVEKFGSAFCDPGKGRIGQPLSFRQAFKMAEIGRILRNNRRRAKQ